MRMTSTSCGFGFMCMTSDWIGRILPFDFYFVKLVHFLFGAIVIGLVQLKLDIDLKILSCIYTLFVFKLQ